MAHLPKEDWLDRAKRLGIGSHVRVVHRLERTSALIIGNEVDHWWAYCQRCKAGGREFKSHVRLDASPEAVRSDLTIPRDMVEVAQLEGYMQATIGSFLASKGMDYAMLPPLWYSDSRKRLLLDTGEGWLGRDITGNARDKWLTYNGTKFVGTDVVRDIAVVTEDPFSMYKVRWALRGAYSTYSALGATIKDSLALALLRHRLVLIMFDGDNAGAAGAKSAVLRVRGLGVPAIEACAPSGRDPKDLHSQAILNLLGEKVSAYCNSFAGGVEQADQTR